MRIFDSLVHVTDDGTWLGTTRYDASENRLLRELDRCAPARACLVGIPGRANNDTVLRVWNSSPDLFVPIAGFNPTDTHGDAISDAVKAIAERGFAGIKLHPRLNDYDPLDGRVLQSISECARHDIVVFVDTLFRQRGRSTRHPADIADTLASECPDTSIVLLHGTGSSLLDLFELGRMHPQLVIDISFTILRYAGSSIDADIRFLAENLDQRLAIGSDFPEYVPSQAYDRFVTLTEDLAEEKRANVLHGNLSRLFAPWDQKQVPAKDSS